MIRIFQVGQPLAKRTVRYDKMSQDVNLHLRKALLLNWTPYHCEANFVLFRCNEGNSEAPQNPAHCWNHGTCWLIEMCGEPTYCQSHETDARATGYICLPECTRVSYPAQWMCITCWLQDRTSHDQTSGDDSDDNEANLEVQGDVHKNFFYQWHYGFICAPIVLFLRTNLNDNGEKKMKKGMYSLLLTARFGKLGARTGRLPQWMGRAV